MKAQLSKELRRVLPLFIGCLLLVAVGTGLVCYREYQVSSSKARPNWARSLDADEISELELLAQKYGQKYARALAEYRFLQQHDMAVEPPETPTAGALMTATAAALPWLLLLPAVLLGAQLATRPTSPKDSLLTVGLARLTVLVGCLTLLAAAALLLVLGAASMLQIGGGLNYPQALNSLFYSEGNAFVVLPRWQAQIVLTVYGIGVGLTLALTAAAAALLCGHWLAGPLLVGGLAVSSQQLPWRFGGRLGLTELLDGAAVWQLTSTPSLLAQRLLLPTAWGMIVLGATIVLFPRTAVPSKLRIGYGRSLLRRIFRSVRWRFILLFVFSAALAALGVLIALGVALQLYRLGLMRELWERLYSLAGLPLIFGFGLMLFVVAFFSLTSRITLYLEEISLAVRQIAGGDWAVKIPKRFNDELGELAENINSMSSQLIAAREEERRAEEAKTELITSVSHDLRTPLTSVLGYLDLIAASEPGDSEEWQHYATVARQKAERLQRLIDGLFEYTRLAYGGLEMHLQPISLSNLLRQLAEEFVPILQQAGMEQRLELPAVNVWVLADGDLLVRVFENLYANAIRYGQAACGMQVTLAADDGLARVQVINYGEPIPEQDLPHIFDRLYRVDKSRSQKAGGAGLGLAIARQIVELHQGTIEVESDLQGTRFTVSLPLTTAGMDDAAQHCLMDGATAKRPPRTQPNDGQGTHESQGQGGGRRGGQ